MKKSQKVLWAEVILFFVASISFCIFSTAALYQRFTEISMQRRYDEYNDMDNLDLFRQHPPTPSALTTKLNDNLQSLVSRYKKGDIPVIDLSSITPFEWDRVHIFADFPKFMNYRDIDHILGKSWRNVESCDYAAVTAGRNPYNASYSIFIFMHKNTIKHCILYKHIEARVYTNSADAEAGIAHNDALFIIDKKGIIRPIEK